jgi:formylglycine-generating enzyme required for sulfatase activity/tRNA A-37 threonylcarbamoyl transferase component Bud32
MSADHPDTPEPTRTIPGPDPNAPTEQRTRTTADGATVSGPGAEQNSSGTVVGSDVDHARAVALASVVTPAPPRVEVPGFVVEAELGRGGMGVVYKARQAALNRPVALKMVLGGHHADPLARARFLVEAEAVAALDHPHVVRVYEFGQFDLPFLAMEFVGGGTLADGLRRDGRPAPRAAVELVAKLAAGVTAAHAKGIVHRDLKPANVLLTEAGEPKVTDFGLAKVGRSDMTGTGAVLGTPSYMSPEQAAGKTREVGTAADVYALGAILYELLTGRPPFRGETWQDTVRRVLADEPARPRSLAPGVPRDLETVCLKCLEKDPRRRYPTAEALAADLGAYLDGRPIAARPVGPAERAWKWARRHPERAAGIAAAVVLAAGLAVAAVEVRRQRETDRLAAEADARERQRETRAAELVRALESAETAGVPRVVADLADVRDLARPKLVDLAAQPPTTKQGLHARLALLADEPELAAELAEYLPGCRSEELLTIRNALKPHAAAVSPGLWAVLTAGHFAPGKRVRAACALAGLAPDDPRWTAVAPAVAAAAVRANPVEFVAWAAALEPVRGTLVPALVRRYPESRSRIEGGKLAVSDLAAEATAFDLTATLLARYAADREELAELAVTVDARHYPLFADAIRVNRAAVVPVLRAELGRAALPGWARTGETGPAFAAALGAGPLADVLDADAVIVARAKRRGHAAAVLVALGEGEAARPVFVFPADGDPTARSHLLARLAGIGADPLSLIRRFDAEDDVSARRAVLVALGDFPPEVVPAAEREALAGRLLGLYRDHPNPGLHSAIDWLLRRKWDKVAEVAAIDAELAGATRAKVVVRAMAGAMPAPVRVGPLLPAPPVAARKDWFVTGEGQTFAVVRGPVEFTLGSPPTEPGRVAVNEPAHRKRVERTFAIATREVTNAELLRFRPGRSWEKRDSPDADSPAVQVSWYDAAAYCNWLSERESIPSDQWCYEPNKDRQYAEGMRMKAGHLGLTGYRLPTEAEWEYACRAGAATARYYGRGDELLPRYAWGLKNGEERAWPAGRLRPNEWGLFDALGNASEWVEDPAFLYDVSAATDRENEKNLFIKDQPIRLLRGGSFDDLPVSLRCAVRFFNRPGNRSTFIGFRPARTLKE